MLVRICSCWEGWGTGECMDGVGSIELCIWVVGYSIEILGIDVGAYVVGSIGEK